MNAGCVGYLGCADNCGHVEVTVDGLRRSDANGLVGKQHVLEVVVSRRMNGDSLDAHFAASAQYSQRNLAAVGNYNFFQHVG